jgi:hypothetical protein
MQKIALRFVCPKTFAKMTEVAGGRYCGDCDKIVRDISAMNEADARALLSAPRNERLCIRYLADKSGSIMFADSAPDAPLLPASFLARAKRVAMTVAGIAAPMAMAACTAQPEQPVEMMGDIGMPTPAETSTTSDSPSNVRNDVVRVEADAASPDGGADADVDGQAVLPN